MNTKLYSKFEELLVLHKNLTFESLKTKQEQESLKVVHDTCILHQIYDDI